MSRCRQQTSAAPFLKDDGALVRGGATDVWLAVSFAVATLHFRRLGPRQVVEAWVCFCCSLLQKQWSVLCSTWGVWWGQGPVGALVFNFRNVSNDTCRANVSVLPSSTDAPWRRDLSSRGHMSEIIHILIRLQGSWLAAPFSKQERGLPKPASGAVSRSTSDTAREALGPAPARFRKCQYSIRLLGSTVLFVQ